MRHPGETDDGRVHQLFGRRCQGKPPVVHLSYRDVDAGVKAVRRFEETPDKKIVDRQAGEPEFMDDAFDCKSDSDGGVVSRRCESAMLYER